MRMFLSLLLGGSLVAGLAAPVTAHAQDTPGYHKKKKQNLARTSRSNRNSDSDYYEKDADKLPIGTSRWFEQMEREGRFGGRGGGG